LPSSRPPDFRGARAFLSPLLGCRAKCGYCYIRSFGYHQRIGVANGYGIENSLRDLYSHPGFQLGANGTIISIGAWGDPFPDEQPAERATSLQWAMAAMESGNPVQVMSRFNPGAEILGLLAGAQTRPGQVLYSTSITTATHWKLFERYSAPPADRMQALRIAKSLGMSTNVMVKPFIPGVTGSSAEVGAISALIRYAGPATVVVGDYAFDSRIATIVKALTQQAGLEPTSGESESGYPLDCASSSVLEISKAEREVMTFVATLRSSGINAFRKSSCASAWVESADLGLRARQEMAGFCVSCGLCEAVDVNSEGPVRTTAP
jgi:DNA repair photolyase